MVKLILETHVGPISQRVISRRDESTTRSACRFDLTPGIRLFLNSPGTPLKRVFPPQIKLGMIADSRQFRRWKMLLYI